MKKRQNVLPSAWDHETDVLIIGYGCAGTAAAIEAHDAGADVLVIDKNLVAGGTTPMAGGIILGAGTSVQRAQGITDTAEEMYRYFRAVGQGLDDPDLARVYCENSGPNIEWLIGLGMEFTKLVMSGAENYPEYAAITPPKPRGHETGGKGRFFKVLKNACDSRGIQCLYRTELKSLLTGPEGEVVGIEAESEGASLCIRARKAVVLACGGYASNPEMLKQYSFDKGYRATYTGSVYHTGDGINAARMLGADLRCMGPIVPIPAVLRPGRRMARIAGPHRSTGGPFGMIIVNRAGKRFTDESGFYIHVAGDMLLPGNLPNYLVFDARLRNAGKFNWPPWSGKSNSDIEDGTTSEAATIRELAAKIGVDPDALEETVDNYNRNAGRGADPEFGKTRNLAPLDTPPFYAFERIVGIASTLGGLRIDTSSRVIDVNGAVIRRLYAAGETTGGALGANYPASGTALQNAICFGRIAGTKAAAENPWE